MLSYCADCILQLYTLSLTLLMITVTLYLYFRIARINLPCCLVPRPQEMCFAELFGMKFHIFETIRS